MLGYGTLRIEGTGVDAVTTPDIADPVGFVRAIQTAREHVAERFERERPRAARPLRQAWRSPRRETEPLTRVPRPARFRNACGRHAIRQTPWSSGGASACRGPT